ncbi:type II toxin-antitoxin system PemK/MazF family toxin [Streptomyces sp. NPDC059378]|uniref:type II toxin-antitoxin system PemK/MazF family toxin n=1 Tax=Streptomyces sp. NPDC059378 TaxID=3346815 RepID=UPI0036827BC2
MLHKLKTYLGNFLDPSSTRPLTWAIHLVWPLAAAYVASLFLDPDPHGDRILPFLSVPAYTAAAYAWWRFAKAVSWKLPATLQPVVRDLLAVVLMIPLFFIAGQLGVVAILLALVAVPLYLWYLFRNRGTAPNVQAGQVWWAEVPFEEDDGTSKDRPVIIRSVHSGSVEAFYVTSKDKDDRPGFTRLECASTWDAQGRQSWAEYIRTRTISLADLRRRGGTLPHQEFSRLCGLHTNETSAWS